MLRDEAGGCFGQRFSGGGAGVKGCQRWCERWSNGGGGWEEERKKVLDTTTTKKDRRNQVLQLRKGTTLDVGDRVWLSLTAQRLHVNHKDGEPMDEGSIPLPGPIVPSNDLLPSQVESPLPIIPIPLPPIVPSNDQLPSQVEPPLLIILFPLPPISPSRDQLPFQVVEPPLPIILVPIPPIIPSDDQHPSQVESPLPIIPVTIPLEENSFVAMMF
uniref:Uncharacterized protein n=1 Tax=Chenopodium quinoa TaxID=63459 RepID=A0A803MTH1_CHEQI